MRVYTRSIAKFIFFIVTLLRNRRAAGRRTLPRSPATLSASNRPYSTIAEGRLRPRRLCAWLRALSSAVICASLRLGKLRCATGLRFKEEARQQLRALAKEQRRNVGRRLDALQSNLAGDVKKLMAKTHEYRLRVGTWRVLFTLEKDLISVYAVRDRKKAYG